MIKNLVRAVLVLRLELRLLSVDPRQVLITWLRRPVIEVIFDRLDRKSRLNRKLDEMFPF
jgi:hypothetical protein